jgi:hypothetical protein
MVESQEMEKKTFPVWNTIQLGTYKTGVELLAAIEGDIGLNLKHRNDEYHVSVHELAPQLPMAASPTFVDVLAVSVADLGLPNSTRLDVIEAAARRYGLCRCTPETAFQVRLQTRQRHREGFYLLATPFGDPERHIRFSLYGLSSAHAIMARIASPEDIYGISDQCVFLWQRAET